MTTRQLSEIILDDGVRSIKFFNGRLLSGEDLSKEQEAQRIERRRLGQAIGSGVVGGLDVRETIGLSSDTAPVLTITAGLAINRQGQTLALGSDIRLALIKTSDAANPTTISGAIGFEACGPTTGTPGVYVAGAGLYLLTIMPSSTTQGRALVSGLQNVDAACNAKYIVDGVQFRLIRLNVADAALNDANHLRNHIAYECFGIEQTANFFRDLWGPELQSYGLVDGLRADRLGDCEVPLAIIYFTANDGLVFLDQWAVRRRVVAPDAAPRWGLLTGDRRRAEAEAMYHQFQAQLQDLRINTANPRDLRLKDFFRYLPPAGIIPLASLRWPIGFNAINIFDGITHQEPIHIEGARLNYLMESSLSYPAVDLQSNIMLWVYKVRENRQPIDENAVDAPQPYVVFASGHMPFLGDAHYDVNRWMYSHFS